VAFVPPTRRIYHQPVRMTIGLRVFWPPHPPADGLICGSCSSGLDFACSFLQTPPHDGRPCCSARSSGHHGLQGTPTPKPLPGSVSLPGCNRHDRASHVASRHAWRTKEKPALAERGLCFRLVERATISFSGTGFEPEPPPSGRRAPGTVSSSRSPCPPGDRTRLSWARRRARRRYRP